MAKKRLTYEEPSPISKAEALRILSLGASEAIATTLVAVAFYEEDFDFALQFVLTCAGSADAGIRGTAILCLGHLARIHRRLPDDNAIDIVRAGLSDPSEYVRGHAESAADDIELFVPSMGRRIRRT